ncbi:hypothetical protein RB195_011933 [Necator americanus]|uniref:SXP/RAL-2 family protein Ani s 5-like cation-binding domain-containing protein n=1 Tax=Necator americanus TaxID=51031 RepID=A0ABR1D6B4_NECAM
MMFFMLCLVLAASLVLVTPLPRRIQDPMDRQISLDKLLDRKVSFNRAALDYYIDILHDYKDYVPKEIQEIFDNLSDQTRNDMVAAVNDIEAGTIRIPNDPQKIIDYVAKHTPQLGDNLDHAMDLLMTNVNKLNPETKKAFKKWWDRVFEAVSCPEDKLANCIARVISDFKAAYDKASNTIKSDVRSVWPQAYNLLESDFAEKFADVAKKFADGGLTMDIHILTADAQYPPKEPKVKIYNNRQSRFNNEFGTDFDK